jgi:hypothetical protein
VPSPTPRYRTACSRPGSASTDASVTALCMQALRSSGRAGFEEAVTVLPDFMKIGGLRISAHNPHQLHPLPCRAPRVTTSLPCGPRSCPPCGPRCAEAVVPLKQERYRDRHHPIQPGVQPGHRPRQEGRKRRSGIHHRPGQACPCAAQHRGIPTHYPPMPQHRRDPIDAGTLGRRVEFPSPREIARPAVFS